MAADWRSGESTGGRKGRCAQAETPPCRKKRDEDGAPFIRFLVLAGEAGFDFFYGAAGGEDRGVGSGFWPFGVSVGKEDALHRLASQRLNFGVEARRGNKYRVAAAVDVHFDWVNVGVGHQFLEIA
jgi:hypothetical protein